jgi:hypothetical protein
MGELVAIPHQLAAVASAVGIRLLQRRGLHAAVEDELQSPQPHSPVAGARPDLLLFQGIEVGVHRSGGRDGGWRREDHRVGADR